VAVFDAPEGLLVVDGYQRLAAARRCGLESVEAEVRSGSRHDGLQYAARVVAAQRGISPEEVASYIGSALRRVHRSVRTSKGGNNPEVVRVWLLGGFRVSVGPRSIGEDVWRLRNAKAIVKLPALAPGHRLHRERV
jgi:hypothetical protein